MLRFTAYHEYSFSNSIHWLSFINEQHFRRTLLDPSEREKIQPSLILAALALATLLHSSELEYGQRGRDRALWLRDAAQSLLESAWNQSILDPSLAQAAMVSVVSPRNRLQFLTFILYIH